MGAGIAQALPIGPSRKNSDYIPWMLIGLKTVLCN